jgi:S-adenosylmethionine hydrolase
VSIITISTDFGQSDPYVGIMKGVILTINPAVRLVDLTQALSPYRLLQGAFILNSAFAYFPRGTAHLVVVDPGVGGERRLLVIQAEDRFWLGPDNGIFTLVLRDHPGAAINQLINQAYFPENISSTFHGRDILAPAAAHLSLGISPKELGPSVSDPVSLPFPEPQIFKNEIIGRLLWADHFGNLISNIHQKILGSALSASPEKIRIGLGPYCLTGIRRTYSQVQPGELLALIGSSGYLEIACNLGSAAERLQFDQEKEMEVRVICPEKNY